MLQAIRDKAQGWIAWAIVILISIPFALWGIQEYLGVGGEPEAAVVEGVPITERMLDQRARDVRASMRASLGDAYSPELFDEVALKQQVRDAMIEEMVMANRAHGWNMQTSDLQARSFINSIPAFKREGRFDQQTYEATVRNRGMSVAGFEQDVRQDLVLSQLRSGVTDSAFVTEYALRERVRLQNQQRSLAYLRIPATQYRDRIEVSEDDLRAFYDENTALYATPERVKLNYLLLDAAGLSGFIEVTEEALESYFIDHRAEFVGREERAMRHILISTSPGADAAELAEAASRAIALRDQIAANADFAELAKANSDDPGSAQNGGDLGWVERGVMVPAFEEAAFSLSVGEVSEPVKTDFGYHLIQVTDIRGASQAEFADVRDEVESAYRRFEAESLYFDYAERLAESAYENASSLMPAAEALGLEIQTTDWFVRDGELPGVLSSPKVKNSAFADDVLIEGHNSELIEIDSQTAVVIRIAEHEPAGTRPFDANRAAIEEDFLRRESSKLAEAEGEQLIERLKSGEESLNAVAGARGWQSDQVDNVGMTDAALPPEVSARAFSMPAPTGEGPRFTGVLANDGDYFVVELQRVEGGDLASLDEAERDALQRRLEGQIASEQLGYFNSSLRSDAKIELKPLGE